MKKNTINSIALILMLILFTACGNNNKDDRPYAFFNAITPVTVVNNGLTYEVSAQLVIAEIASPGQRVDMKVFDSKYGRILNSPVFTDSNGNATFIYQAPSGSKYEAIKGQDTIIEAVFFDPVPPDSNSTSRPEVPNILAVQEFVLQFR